MEFIPFISSVFALPATAVNIQKLPKKFFYKSFDLLPSEKKMIEDPAILEQFEILSLINPRSANIPAVHTEEETYDEIIFLLVKTSSLHFESHKTRIAEILHKYIPNHLMVVVYGDDKMSLSIAEKRINQNDSTKRVITQVYCTENINWPNPVSQHQLFLEKLAFHEANTFNLQQYYQYFIQCFSGLLLTESTGQFRLRSFERSKHDVAVINQIQELNNQIIALQNQAKIQKQMYERVTINTKVAENRTAIKKLRDSLEN